MEQPQSIRRPCDYGLELAVWNCETQLGTIEAYNRIVEAAARMRERIDHGDIRPQSPQYAVSVTG